MKGRNWCTLDDWLAQRLQRHHCGRPSLEKRPCSCRRSRHSSPSLTWRCLPPCPSRWVRKGGSKSTVPERCRKEISWAQYWLSSSIIKVLKPSLVCTVSAPFGGDHTEHCDTVGDMSLLLFELFKLGMTINPSMAAIFGTKAAYAYDGKG